MRPLLSLLSIAVVLLLPLPGRPQEPAEKQIEFVRALQAKGYGDLALEYLERLKKNPPPGIGPLLPLEMARTRVSMARTKEPGQRLVLYGEARTELENYLKANVGKPEATAIRLEIARIAGYEGEALLSKALAQEDKKQEEEYARKAEQRFIQSGAELDAAIKAGEAQLKAGFKGSNPEEAKTLEKNLAKDLARAKLERAKTYLEQARTYLDTSTLELKEKRGKLVEAARDILKNMVKDETDPATSYLAYAWLIRADYESEAPTAAHDHYLRVMNFQGRAARPAKRLAKLLWIQHIDQDVTIKATGLQKLKLIEKECNNWLSSYPEARNTAEGQAIRFELARSLIEQALAMGKGDLKLPAAKKLADRAQKLLAPLAASDSDYSNKAKRLDVLISLKRMGENKAIDQLKDFEECFLRARVEMAKLDQLAKKDKTDPKELESRRKEHLKDLVGALERGLQLARAKTPGSKTSASQRDEARYLLTVAYLMEGNLQKAGQMGEKLARARDPSKWSAPAAAYALQAWSRLAQTGAEDEEGRKRREEARKHLHDLAEFIVKDKAQIWQSEPVVPFARYELALMAMRDHKHAEAVEQLEKLPPDFSAYVFAQCQAAYEALNVAKEARTDEEKSAWKQRALAILKRIADKLPANADSPTAQMFFAAQIEQGKLLFEEGSRRARQGDLKGAAVKYGEMVQFVSRLEQQFAKSSAPIPAQPRKQLQQALGTLKKYGLLGAADLEYRAGNYDKVLSKDLAGGVLAQVQTLGKGNGAIALPDSQLTGDILGLALRAQVQKGDLKGAESTLNLLQRLGDTEGQLLDPAAPLRSLLGELQAQIRDLRAKGDQARLKQTIETFSRFIDTLAQRGGKTSLTRNDIIFLANCYNSLEEYEKAAKLYAQVQPPPKPKDNSDEANKKYEADRQAYWLMQVLYGAALRKSKQFAQAKKVLDRVLTTKDAVGKLLAEKEEIHLLEDKADKEPGLWGNAIKRWGQFLKNPQLRDRLAQDNEAKKVFFESYYHLARAWFKYSQIPKLKGTNREEKYVNIAADYIRRLETAKNQDGWRIAGPLFHELLRQEPVLNQAYERLKKGS
jgi:hypothetical protein